MNPPSNARRVVVASMLRAAERRLKAQIQRGASRRVTSRARMRSLWSHVSMSTRAQVALAHSDVAPTAARPTTLRLLLRRVTGFADWRRQANIQANALGMQSGCAVSRQLRSGWRVRDRGAKRWSAASSGHVELGNWSKAARALKHVVGRSLSGRSARSRPSCLTPDRRPGTARLHRATQIETVRRR